MSSSVGSRIVVGTLDYKKKGSVIHSWAVVLSATLAPMTAATVRLDSRGWPRDRQLGLAALSATRHYMRPAAPVAGWDMATQ